MAGSTSNGIGLPKRNDVAEEYKWRLEDIFPDDDAWETEFQAAKELIKTADQLVGKVGASAENLLAAIRLEEQVYLHIERVAGYAIMRRDEENSNPRYQGMAQRAFTLASQAASALSYIDPEILATPEETIRGYLEELDALKIYTHSIDNVLRRKEHVLPAREEQILAEVSEIANEPDTIFTMLNNADLRFGTVTNEDGEEVELTHGRYIQFLRSQDRRLRKESFEKLFARYVDFKNTLAATYSASVKADTFYARMRKHPSALAAKLHPDNVNVEVYENLIKTVRANLPALHRYLRLRRDILGLDALHVYDLYVPLVHDVKFSIPWEESRRIVKEGLAPLGEEYLAALDEAFNKRWIDVYETENKTSGGYVRDVFGVHPYVLLNYHDGIDDLFTLVHELGHAMHSHFTLKAQPFVYANYSIFVAEVASTVNEALLVNHLLNSETDPMRRLYILDYYLEQFRGSVFRQTLFAEFEKVVHEQAEQGEALTAESLSHVYRGLTEDYYGAEVRIDDQLAVEWARVPHFYSAFYVYKYATGFAAANALAQGILSGKEGAVQRYLDFLAAGSSDYPLNVLARAGVDMQTPKPIEEAMQVFNRLLEETEVLAARHGMGR